MLSVACFDAPVRYSLEILFGAEGSEEIHASTVIRDEWQDTDQARVRDRIEATRDAIRHGEDIWSRALRALEPDRERLVYDYKDGFLVGAVRLATAEDPSSLEKLFAVTSVSAYVERDGKTMSLELVPAGTGEATQRQERQIAEALESFSEAVSKHMQALAGLYAWLEDHPDRARWAMGELVGADGDEEAPGPTPEGLGLLQRADETGEALMAVLQVEDDSAYSLDEISRLVHDPFPSPVTIEVVGEVMEVEGFLPGEDRRFSTRTHGLWDGLVTLHGRWVEPVPMVEAVAALRRSGNDQEMDEEALLESLLARPRVVHELPDSAAVHSALISELTPPDLYRLRWRLP